VKCLLSVEHKVKYVVDLNIGDSNQRIPNMNSGLNVDCKMAKLLLDRIYLFETDHQCLSTERMTYTSPNEIVMMVSIKNKFTLFNHLILPFDYFNYTKADSIFAFM